MQPLLGPFGPFLKLSISASHSEPACVAMHADRPLSYLPSIRGPQMTTQLNNGYEAQPVISFPQNTQRVLPISWTRQGRQSCNYFIRLPALSKITVSMPWKRLIIFRINCVRLKIGFQNCQTMLFKKPLLMSNNRPQRCWKVAAGCSE